MGKNRKKETQEVSLWIVLLSLIPLFALFAYSFYHMLSVHELTFTVGYCSKTADLPEYVEYYVMSSRPKGDILGAYEPFPCYIRCVGGIEIEKGKTYHIVFKFDKEVLPFIRILQIEEVQIG